MKTRTKYTEFGADFDQEFELVGNPTATDLDLAKAQLEQALAPASNAEVIKSLVILKSLTIRRKEADDDQEIQLRAYASQLSEWPADVVAHVLKTQAGISKWWPSWAELQDRLEFHAGRRKRLLKALNVQSFKSLGQLPPGPSNRHPL